MPFITPLLIHEKREMLLGIVGAGLEKITERDSGLLRNGNRAAFYQNT